MYKFESKVEFCGHVPVGHMELMIPKEKMVIKADRAFAMEHGGDITREALKHLPTDWQNIAVAIDTRVHMLMPGMYPCIPGWHHDYVPRTKENGQPDYDDESGLRSEHLMLMINSEVAPTKFAIGEAEYDDVVSGNVYGQWHKETEWHLSSGKLQEVDAVSNQWILFDDRSMHRGVKATKMGWRYFIRVSRFFIDVSKHTHVEGDRVYLEPAKMRNEQRTQVQVYMDDPTVGW